MVGPPSNLDWSRPWHEILHEWNGKVQSVALEHGMKLWSHRSLTHCWKLAMHFLFFFPSRAFLTARRSKGTGLFYWAASRHRLFLYWPVSKCACGREGISMYKSSFASLPHDRWIQRILKWTPGGRYAAGCPRHNWVTKISAFMRFLQVDDWQRLAQDTPVWLHLTEEFVQFCRR